MTEYLIPLDDETDEFEYELHHSEKYGWVIEVIDPCPNCGGNAIFSGSIVENAQYLSMTTDIETDNHILAPDDVMSVEVEYLRCNECWETVVDNTD